MYQNYTATHTQDDVTKAISEYGPYRFFITITFQTLQTDKDAREILGLIVRRAHKQLLGRRWKGHHNPLSGIIVVEYAHLIRKQSRDRGNCHFHILLRDHEHFSRDDYVAAISVHKGFLSAAKAANLNRSKKPIGNNNVHLRPVTTDGICDYLSKEARKPDWRMSERILFITDEGIS